MSRLARFSAYLMGTVGAVAWGHAAQAQDLFSPTPISQQTQAVSAFNGQWVIGVGSMDPGGGFFTATGSLTTPVENYGLQGDFTVTGSSEDGLTGALTLHAFARDPSAGWMLGVTKGVVVTHDAALVAFGAEGEFYIDRLSLEGWAGLAGVTYSNGSDPESGFFAFGDAAYYPTDDLRLVAGASTVLGNNQLHLASEYLLREWNLPISLIADARIGADSSTFMVGLHGYFGGNDENKSLILRHREDNLRLRSLDLWAAAAPALQPPAGPPGPGYVDPELNADNCTAMGGDWIPYGELTGDCNVTNVSQEVCDWFGADPDNTVYYDDYVWYPESGPDGECLPYVAP